jgi:hypothetical protein
VTLTLLLKLLLHSLRLSLSGGDAILIVGVSGDSGCPCEGGDLGGVRSCSVVSLSSSTSSSEFEAEENIIVQRPSSMLVLISLVGRPAKFADGSISTGMS